MKEISIQDHIQTMLPSPFEGPQAKEEQGESFLNTLNDAIGEVNELRNEADRAVEELAAGEEKDIHNTMIALEKAEISFQLMMQVRNKIITAYETIMRTTV
jgi:flagellar hook-basal body complex protein FliE